MRTEDESLFWVQCFTADCVTKGPLAEVPDLDEVHTWHSLVTKTKKKAISMWNNRQVGKTEQVDLKTQIELPD